MCVVATRIFALLDQLRQQLESLETSSDPEETPEDQNDENAAGEDAPAPKNDFFEFAREENGYEDAEEGELLWAKYQRSRGAEFERENAFYVDPDDETVRDADTQPVVFAQATAFVNELLYADNLALGAYIAATEERAKRAYLLKAVEDLDPRQDVDLEGRRSELAKLTDAELAGRLDAGAREKFAQTDFGALVDITQAVHRALAAEASLLEQKARQIALVEDGLLFCRDAGRVRAYYQHCCDLVERRPAGFCGGEGAWESSELVKPGEFQIDRSTSPLECALLAARRGRSPVELLGLSGARIECENAVVGVLQRLEREIG